MGQQRQGGSVGRERVATVIRLAKVLEMILVGDGLTPNQYRLLTLIERETPSQAELCARLAMKAPNVTALVDGLVRRNLVRRARDTRDGRRRALRLTPTGRKLLGRVGDAGALVLEVLAAQAGQAPRELLQALDRWAEPLDAVAEELRRGLR